MRDIGALTGLRGIAALWVFFVHVAGAMHGGSPELSAVLAFLGKAGYLGVDIFFVLSGFVLALNYAEAGVQHVVSAPWRSDLDGWLRSMELLAELVVDR